MKLKSNPQDFQVTELSSFRANGGGFALYQLSKTSIGTPEAINAILQTWDLPRNRISWGGMKDRHATTFQSVTIFQGPQKDLRDRSFSLEYLGQASRAFSAQDIDGNQFQIRLRGIAKSKTSKISQRLELIQNCGLVNYFDNQRFGSLGQSGRFIAEPWCKGDFEAALFLALAEPNHHDRSRESEQKAILRQHWGEWKDCKQRLDRSHRRSIVTYLVDYPTGFRRALGLLRSDLRSIYLAAFQSALWNQWLSRIIHRKCSPKVVTTQSAIGHLSLPVLETGRDALDSTASQLDWLQDLRLPLPSARQHDWPSDYVDDLDSILEQYSLTRREIRLKYPRDTFFSKGVRECWLRVGDFQFQWQDDDLNPGNQSLLLNFRLQRGAYATMIIKLLQADG